jgi:YVTN family beta-propeller protein
LDQQLRSTRIAAALAASLALAACSSSSTTTTTTTPTTPTTTDPTGTHELGGDAMASVGGGTASKLWIVDGKYHEVVTSIWADGADGRNLPRLTTDHQWNYPDLHDTHAVCVTKDFSRVYTANWFSYDENSYAIEFDPVTLKQTRRVQVGKGGHHCALSPDDKYLYVANQYATTLSVIDLATFTKVTDIELGGEVVYPTPTMYWDGVAIDTPYIFVSVMGPAPIDNNTPGTGADVNGVAVIDWKTNTLVKTIPIGTMIHGVNLTPDGKEVWVAQLNGESATGNAGTGDFTVIDVATLQIKKRVKMGAGTIHVVFDRTNAFGFVTGTDSNLYKIDRASYGVVWKVATETVGAHLGVTPDNKEVWTLNHGMNAARYPYQLGGLAPTGIQVFGAGDGHLSAEMTTAAVSLESQFVPRATFGKAVALTGAQLYATNCSTCHGASGAGGMGGPTITGLSSAVVKVFIENGGTGMPSFKARLTAEEVQLLADFVATLK